MARGLIARASVTIRAPVSRVWDALVSPALIKQYMFGTDVVSDWKEGSTITWKGEWQGKAYEDKGTILRVQKDHLLEFSHYSPLSGMPDVPEHYHTVTIQLFGSPNGTSVLLSQDNNEGEEARIHSEANWQMMLETLTHLLEEQAR